MDHRSPAAQPTGTGLLMDTQEVDLQKETVEEMLLSLLLGNPRGITAEDAWQGLVNLAARHGVAELLYHRLSQQGVTIPLAFGQELQKNYLISAARNSVFYHELANLLPALGERHLPVIVLKGAFLAEKVYQNIAARPMGDLDLLILEKDLPQVDALLLELGYRRQFHSLEMPEEAHALPYVHSQKGLVVEVHWVLMNLRYGMQADIAQLWQRASPATLAGLPALALAPEDLILHLCIHASVHVFEIGLRAVCDLEAVIRHYGDQVDWEVLRQRALQWKAERCVYINLRLASELMQASLPQGWLETVQPAGFKELYYQLAKEHMLYSAQAPNAALPGAPGIARFWAEETWSKKLQLLLRRAFPPREEMARMYPAPADSWRIVLYYPVRVFDLLHRFGKLGMHLLAGERQTLSRARRQEAVNNLRDWLITRPPEPPGV